MRSLRLLWGILPAALLLGCPKKGGDAADATADVEVVEAAASADATAAAAPTAKNAGDVARFPGETKIDSEKVKTTIAVVARTAARSGNAVATLKVGSEVTKLAEHNDAVLITFADPKDATSTLMGWVTKDAFVEPKDAGVKDASVDSGVKDAGVDAGKAALKCAAGQEAVILGAGHEPVCKKKCTKNTDCKGGAVGACATAASASGKATQVCVAD